MFMFRKETALPRVEGRTDSIQFQHIPEANATPSVQKLMLKRRRTPWPSVSRAEPMKNYENVRASQRGDF